jgi:hypothetical protein
VRDAGEGTTLDQTSDRVVGDLEDDGDLGHGVHRRLRLTETRQVRPEQPLDSPFHCRLDLGLDRHRTHRRPSRLPQVPNRHVLLSEFHGPIIRIDLSKILSVTSAADGDPAMPICQGATMDG